jgi:hypothetical protein
VAEAVDLALSQLPELAARAAERWKPFRAFHHPGRLVEFVCGADVLRGTAAPNPAKDVA